MTSPNAYLSVLRELARGFEILLVACFCFTRGRENMYIRGMMFDGVVFGISKIMLTIHDDTQINSSGIFLGRT